MATTKKTKTAGRTRRAAVALLVALALLAGRVDPTSAEAAPGRPTAAAKETIR